MQKCQGEAVKGNLEAGGDLAPPILGGELVGVEEAGRAAGPGNQVVEVETGV